MAPFFTSQMAQVKNPPCGKGTSDVGLIPGLRRSPEVGNGTLYQYSCLENLMDRGAIVHGVANSQKQLSTYAYMHTHTHTHTHTHCINMFKATTFSEITWNKCS